MYNIHDNLIFSQSILHDYLDNIIQVNTEILEKQQKMVKDLFVVYKNDFRYWRKVAEMIVKEHKKQEKEGRGSPDIGSRYIEEGK